MGVTLPCPLVEPAVDDEPADDEPADDELADDEPADDPAVDDEPAEGDEPAEDDELVEDDEPADEPADPGLLVEVPLPPPLPELEHAASTMAATIITATGGYRRNSRLVLTLKPPSERALQDRMEYPVIACGGPARLPGRHIGGR